VLSVLKSLAEEYIDRQGGGDGIYSTPIPELTIMRASHEISPHRMIYKPALCIVVQGAKQVMFGEDTLTYTAGAALVVSVETPALGRVAEASHAQPYLGLTLEFDSLVVREMAAVINQPPVNASEESGLFVETLSKPVIDCISRIIRLCETPEAIPVLYPAIVKEIFYWLLTGNNAARIARIGLPDGHTQRIASAIHVLRENFALPVRVEDLAITARMSLSSFHHHFKNLTAMSPLQYQKQIRLLEARRLLASDAANVTQAALRVGYESPSQFSREYLRMFGTQPKQDAINSKIAGLPL